MNHKTTLQCEHVLFNNKFIQTKINYKNSTHQLLNNFFALRSDLNQKVKKNNPAQFPSILMNHRP